MSKLWVVYDEYRYEISPPDPPEVEWGQTGDYGLNVTISEVRKSNPNTGGMWNVSAINDGDYSDGFYGVDEIPVGEKAYIVVAEYTDGDTFGSSGYWCVPAIKATLIDAIEAENRCNDIDKEYTGYRPWEGYFAGLNRVRIDVLTVNP